MVFAPFERRVGVPNHARRVLVLGRGEIVSEPAERAVLGHRCEQQLGAAARHGAGRAHDQLARRRVGQMHPLEVDDDIARLGGKLRQPAQQLLGGGPSER